MRIWILKVGPEAEATQKSILKTIATLNQASDISIESLPGYLKKKIVMIAD
jgi:hypothetical protein